MSYTPFYGPPGPSSGWANDPSGHTPVTEEALDTMEQGIIDNDAAVDELAPGAPGSRVVDYGKLPVGTTAGTVAAGDDSRLVGSDPELVFAPLLIREDSPGVYTRPATEHACMFIGTVACSNGGTTAGGTGGNVGVADLDFSIVVP